MTKDDQKKQAGNLRSGRGLLALHLATPKAVDPGLILRSAIEVLQTAI